MRKFKTFPELVQWVADHYHDGVVDAIATRAPISGALADKWVKGKVRTPRPDTLMKFCDAYGLDFAEVFRLVYGPLARRGAAAIMGAVLLLATGWGSAEASGLALENGHTKVPLLGNWLRRWWRVGGFSTQSCRGIPSLAGCYAA